MLDGDDEPLGEARLRDLVTGCAMTCPSGVVYLSGDADAALYLADGRIAYAEPSSAPGLGVRLVAGGRLDWQRWTDLRTAAMAQSDLPSVLLETGTVTRPELETMLRATIVDALFELLAAPTSTYRARTIPSPTRWTGRLVRIPAETALDDAAHAMRRALEGGVSPDDVLEPLDPTGGVVLTDAQWQLRWEVDGKQTVRQLAWRTGTSLVEALDAEAGLVRVGLCAVDGAPVRPASARPALSVRRGPERVPDDVTGATATAPAIAETSEQPGPPVVSPGPPTVRVPREAPDSASVLPRRETVPRPWDAGSGAGDDTTPATPLTDVALIERILHALRERR